MAQSKSKSRFDETVVHYTNWVIRWRWAVMIGSLVITLLMANGSKYLTFATDYRAFFSKDNAQLAAFEKLQRIYSKSDNILFVIATSDRQIFSRTTLTAVEKLTDAAWKIPYTIRVDAVTNFQHTQVNGDELVVGDLVEQASQLSSTALEQIGGTALAEPLLVNRLISPQAHVTGINVTQHFPGKDISEVPESVAHARDLARTIEQAFPDIKIYLTGITIANNAFIEASRKDMQTLIPLMFLAMLLIMAVCLRSVSGMFATLVVVVFSTLTAMGLAGWFRVGLTAPSAQAPTIIMTLAIADCIHILVTLLREMRRGKSKRDAIIESMRINMQPVFLTSISTAIGFLCLNFSDVPPFRHLGNMTASGVMAAFGFSVLFLPALAAILPMRVGRQAPSRFAVIDRIAEFVIRRRSALLGTCAAVVLILAAFIPRNQLNDGFVDYFEDDNAFRRDTKFAESNLTGVYQIDYSLSSGASGGVNEPSYLNKVDEFANWLRQQPNVRHVAAYTDIVKRLHRNMHGDDPDYFRIPESRELAAQYLLLYEMSLPYGLDLNNQVNIDKSSTRLTVSLADVSSKEIVAASERGEKWLRQNAPASMFSYGVSPAVIFAKISAVNIKSIIRGGLVGLVLISLLLVLALRNIKLGLLSLIPNLAPIIMAFGLWGLLSAKVDMAIAVVIGMTMGIIVDDTIHFLSKYQRARREEGLDAVSAVRAAFSSVGLALVVTSLILVVGFSVLTFSGFAMNGNMAKLTVATIVFALLADFLLLPSLLIKSEEVKMAARERGGCQQHPQKSLRASMNRRFILFEKGQ